MATQGDRAELRAEAHYFAEALKKASDEGDTKEKSVYWRRAGHPLFVVVLGGILATLIAASLQRQHFLEQQSLIQQQQFQEKRYKLLADFSEPFRKYMTILYNI